MMALLLAGSCFGTTVCAQFSGLLDEKARDRAGEQPNAPGRRLSIHPAVEPRPALKYRLLPAPYERKPGDAATLYKTAALLLAECRDASLDARIREWGKAPIAELPRADVAEAVARFSDVLRHVELGAWRARCDWEWPTEEGAAMLLPDLGAYRDMARVLALRARLDILERDYGAALHTLETGFAFASHVAEGPILINDLVGIAMADVFLDVVEELIQAPGAPDLYWALTALPRPMLDMREAIEFELCGMGLWPEVLRNPDETWRSPRQWAVVFNQFGGLVAGMHGEGGVRSGLTAAGIGLAAYTDAKRHLLDEGTAAEEVEAMPVLQVVAIYLRDGWRLRADEALKWWYTPYSQARLDADHMERIASEAQSNMSGLLAALVMPSLGRARFRQAKLDRRIAALRAAEAIRLAIGKTGGRLPERLDEIEGLPLPLNPMSGAPFTYELRDGMAILSAPREEHEKPEQALRYEIRVAE
jgi:hypothetical protein